jgi:putative pyruvate formate lyase activating enzyme
MGLTTKELEQRTEKLFSLLESCTLCPRQCRVNRLKGETKYCRLDSRLKISSIAAHHGEEPPISGSRGSGTIFFSHCNLKCVYCQNYQISHQGQGSRVTVEKLAEEMVHLQNQGSHNINLVSPTHQVAGIVKALGHVGKIAEE